VRGNQKILEVGKKIDAGLVEAKVGRCNLSWCMNLEVLDAVLRLICLIDSLHLLQFVEK
jgi:hypothetical protein